MKTPKYTQMDSIQTVAKAMITYNNNQTLEFKAEYVPATKNTPQHWKLSRMIMTNIPLRNLKWEAI